MRGRTFKIWFLFMLVFTGMESYAQKIDATRQLSAMDSIKQLLADYTNWHSFTEDGASVSEYTIQNFYSLFGADNSSMLINDLSPDASKSAGSTEVAQAASVGIEEYLDIVRNDYKMGLFVNVNYELDFQSDVFFDNKTQRFYLYVPVQKSLTGMYRLSQVHRYEAEQVLKIDFKSNASDVSEFRIVEIITPRVLVKREIKDHWKGFYAGAGGTINQNHLLFIHPFQDDPAPHINNTPVLSYSVAAMMQYNFGGKTGFQLEFVYKNFAVNQSIDGYNFQDPNLTRDIDDDNYNKITEVDTFSTEINFTMIEIPVLLNLRPVVSNHIAWNIQLGIRNQFILNSTSKLSGSVEYKGYYPEYPVILYGLPEYGFISENFPGDETSVESDKYTLLGSLGTGIEFRISQKFLGGVGLRADYSILEFNTRQTALDPEFHDLIIPSTSRMMVFNIYFNLLYKIF